MTRLKHLRAWPLRLPPMSRRRWLLAALAAVALVLAALLLFYRRAPPAPDAALLATLHAQVYLQDAEVAARLAVLKTWLQERRDLDEIEPLYTAAVDLLRAGHGALGATPPWTALEPDVTRLGVQIADGDDAALTTIDNLTSALQR